MEIRVWGCHTVTGNLLEKYCFVQRCGFRVCNSAQIVMELSVVVSKCWLLNDIIGKGARWRGQRIWVVQQMETAAVCTCVTLEISAESMGDIPSKWSVRYWTWAGKRSGYHCVIHTLFRCISGQFRVGWEDIVTVSMRLGWDLAERCGLELLGSRRCHLHFYIKCGCCILSSSQQLVFWSFFFEVTISCFNPYLVL